MRLRYLAVLGFACSLPFLTGEETIAKAVKSDLPPPIKKGTPPSLSNSETGETKKSTPKKSADFQVNLYEQHSQLRKNGGTPKVQHRRLLNGRVLPTPKYFWKADETKPISRLVIKLEEQKIYGFQGSTLIMESDISSGREAYATKSGSYTVLEKSKDHKSSLFGSFLNEKGGLVNANAEAGQAVPAGLHYLPSSMPYYIRLTHEGLGLHAGILPGYPASHGCVRLPNFIAEKLFASVDLNTPVEICP